MLVGPRDIIAHVIVLIFLPGIGGRWQSFGFPVMPRISVAAVLAPLLPTCEPILRGSIQLATTATIAAAPAGASCH